MEFRVKWEIEIEAESETAAAEEALCIQRDPESMATIFEVAQAWAPVEGCKPLFIEVRPDRTSVLSKWKENRCRRK